MKPKISLIAAIGKNRELGKNNKLIWHIPEDLEHFKETTRGHPVIMGRKTYESIGRPLPKRVNIVVTRDSNFKAEGTIIVNSLEEAINMAKKYDEEEIFVIGGGQIYNQAIGIADKLYLTVVEGSFEADTFFPDYSAFKKIISEKNGKSNELKYKFLELEK